MSHNEIIDLEIGDLKVLAATVKRMNGELILNKKTYRWYGHNVGDYPLPEGVKAEDLGKCKHAIVFPDIDYQVGVIESRSKKGAYELLWDFYDRQLKERMGGEKGIALIQHYTMVKAKNAATQKGKICRESMIKTKTGIKRKIVINV